MDKVNLSNVICTVYEEKKVFYLFINVISHQYVVCDKLRYTLTALDPTKSHYSSILYAVTNFSYASLLIPPYFYFLYKKIVANLF